MISSNRNIFALDLAIIIPTLLLVIIGLVSVYSATYYGSTATQALFHKQFYVSILGVVIMVVIAYIPFKYIRLSSYPFYLITLILLTVVLMNGVRGYGAERWISIVGLQVQPSEFAKIATILTVARYLSLQNRDVNKIQHLAIVFLIILLPFALIVKQPDLGTSLVYFAIILPMLFFSGLSWFTMFVLLPPIITMIASFHLYSFMVWVFLICIVLILSSWKFIYKVLIFFQHILVGVLTPVLWDTFHEYQKMRILTFLQPEQDPKGAGYQIIQSKVAIGSGGIWGKGFLQGSQSQLNFLPAHHTDFIFSVIGEEHGFLGVFVVLTIYVILILYLLHLASQMKSQFARLSIIGFVTVILFHTLVNIGMTVGLAPVTGLPLPFISYGGSFLLTNCIMIGLCLNFSRNRFN